MKRMFVDEKVFAQFERAFRSRAKRSDGVLLQKGKIDTTIPDEIGNLLMGFQARASVGRVSNDFWVVRHDNRFSVAQACEEFAAYLQESQVQWSILALRPSVEGHAPVLLEMLPGSALDAGGRRSGLVREVPWVRPAVVAVVAVAVALGVGLPLGVMGTSGGIPRGAGFLFAGVAGVVCGALAEWARSAVRARGAGLRRRLGAAVVAQQGEARTRTVQDFVAVLTAQAKPMAVIVPDLGQLDTWSQEVLLATMASDGQPHHGTILWIVFEPEGVSEVLSARVERAAVSTGGAKAGTRIYTNYVLRRVPALVDEGQPVSA